MENLIKRRDDLIQKSRQYALTLNRLQAMDIDGKFTFDIKLHLADINHYKSAYKSILNEISFYDEEIKNHR